MTDFPEQLAWHDVLDIMFTAVTVHLVLLPVQQRLAIRLLLLLVVLLLAAVLAIQVGFTTLYWTLISVAILVVVSLTIGFHADIRRVVLSLCTRHTDAAAGGQSVIPELITAVCSLSERKIGALIVLEREIPLAPFLDVGTEIDAKVTSELITSIFLPYSPIHDGAVIIQNGKLTMAGCFLPLSRDPRINKSMGSRHRAALGLSELLDAVVIVVSEETGAMSVAFGGRLNVDLDRSTIQRVLQRLLGPRPEHVETTDV